MTQSKYYSYCIEVPAYQQTVEVDFLKNWDLILACGLTAGSQRFERLWAAAQSDQEGPPADLRFLKRACSKVAGESSTARVVSFLETLYESVAETLPDVRDDGIAANLVEPIIAEGDGYAEKLAVEGTVTASEPLKQMHAEQKRPRKRKKGLQLHPERHPDVSKLEIRYLPPSTMKEHWETMQSLDGREAVSFGTFWKTWHREYPHLRIRPASSHTQCTNCIRYKLMIRQLSNHLCARQNQQELLNKHLMAQYRDRQVYWALRGSSRLRLGSQVALILDGMDQCKFSYPRSRMTSSKDLSNMVRPRLQVTGSIVHGYCLAFVVSNHDHSKDSSASCEVLAHFLTRLQQMGVPLHSTDVNVQSDNTVREVKNNTLLRFLSACVSHRILAGKSSTVGSPHNRPLILKD